MQHEKYSIKVVKIDILFCHNIYLYYFCSTNYLFLIIQISDIYIFYIRKDCKPLLYNKVCVGLCLYVKMIKSHVYRLISTSIKGKFFCLI